MNFISVKKYKKGKQGGTQNCCCILGKTIIQPIINNVYLGKKLNSACLTHVCGPPGH